MGCVADASFMLIKDLEKLPKKTLRERIYEEVVRLIVSVNCRVANGSTRSRLSTGCG
jgi:hypothetical protein